MRLFLEKLRRGTCQDTSKKKAVMELGTIRMSSEAALRSRAVDSQSPCQAEVGATGMPA